MSEQLCFLSEEEQEEFGVNVSPLDARIRRANERVIKSTSYIQHEIINNIIRLYLGGRSFDADITYSEGAFYGVFQYTEENGDVVAFDIPKPRFRFDVAPQQEDTVRIDQWGKLPLEDGSVESVMFDPPFVISPRTCPSVLDGRDGSCMIYNRFSGYYPVNEMLDSYSHWMMECYRVLKDGGFMVFKCQPTVSGGKQINTHHFVWFMGESIGFDMVDEFVLLSKGRLISGKIIEQQHARKFHSYFYVLRKSTKKKATYLNFMDSGEAAYTAECFVKNNIGKSCGNRAHRDSYAPLTHVMDAEEKKRIMEIVNRGN